MKRKMLAILLTLCMILSMMPMVAFATETNVSVWDGSIDTAWYNTTDTEFTIDTAAELAGFAAIANGTAEGIVADTFAGKTIKLGADIDLANREWAPIGGRTSSTLSGQIECTFDGQGHTISNLKVTKGSSYESVNMNMGLFGITRTGKFVAKDFTINNVDIYGNGSVAAVLGRTINCKAVIEDVTVQGNIKLEATNINVGAICAEGYMAVIKNCRVIGNDGSYIKAGAKQAGGILGWSGESSNVTTVTGCTVENVTVSAPKYVGAVAAIVQYGAAVTNNTVKNVELTALTDEYHYGTVVGSVCAGYVTSAGKNTAPVYLSGNTATNVSVTLNEESVASPVEYGAHYESAVYLSVKNGDGHYENLKVAIEDAGENDTITLLKSVEVTNAITLDEEKNITLDLNGYNITSNGCDVFEVQKGTLKVTGSGIVTAGDGGQYIAAWANGGAIEIYGGTWNGGTDAEGVGNDTIYTKNEGTVKIYGGHFTAQLNEKSYAEPQYTILNRNDSTGGEIRVFGGTFEKFDPDNNVSESSRESFTAKGYKSVEIETDLYEVVYDAGSVVAKIGEDIYTSFQDAMDNVQEGEEVVLQKSVEVTDVITLNEEKNVTLNLNGNNITSVGCDVFEIAVGTLKVTGSGIVTAGDGGQYIAVWANGGNVEIYGGTWNGGKDAEGVGNDTIYTKNTGTVKIYGGYFTAQLNTESYAEDQYCILNKNDATGGDIKVYGGTFEKFDPADNVSENPVISFVADGYSSIARENNVFEVIQGASYKVTFNGNGGNCGTAYVYTHEAESLPTPTRTGYNFGGWYLEPECTTQFDLESVAGDVTVYAKWTKKPSTSSPSTGGGSTTTTTTPVVSTDDKTEENVAGDKVTTTETTAKPEATVTGTTAKTEISESVADQIVEQATKNESHEVVIAPEVSETKEVEKAEVVIPAATVDKIGNDTNANLTVSTPVADVAISNEGLTDLAEEKAAVTVSAEKKEDTIVVEVKSGDKAVSNVSGGLTVTVPVEETSAGMVAVIVHEDGTEEVIRQTVAGEDALEIPLEGSATIKIVDNSKEFDDVSEDDWHNDAVDFAASRELFNGTSATTFSPEASMTRGMLAVVLHNLESNPEHEHEGNFHDVHDQKYYADAVAWAAGEGLVSGYGNGSYGPDDHITRQQLAVILWKYAGCPESDHELDFADGDNIAGYAEAALKWANEHKIINGKGGGKLDPTGNATRAEVAQMLKNFMENVK